MTPAEMALVHGRAFNATRAWSASEFETLAKHPGTFVTGDTRSFALLRVTLDEAEVLTIATDPAHQREGRARHVLARAEIDARHRGATRIFLEVSEDNTAARGLYDQAGYAQVGRRPGYYTTKGRPSVAALVLCKALPAA